MSAADEQVGDRDGFGREIARRELRLLIGGGNLVAQKDEHDRRRDDLPQRAGGADRSAGDRRSVTALEHGRQRQQPHRYHRGADDPRRCGEQRADHAHRDAEAAAQPAHEQSHGVQQRLGEFRALEHHPHEDEQRHRDEQVVGHDAVDAVGERLHEGEFEDLEMGADQRVDQRHPRQGEGDGEAQQQRAAQGEHHREDIELVDHAAAPTMRGRGSRAARGRNPATWRRRAPSATALAESPSPRRSRCTS